MKQVLITAAIKSHIALFHCNLAAMLREKGYEVHAAAGNDLTDKSGLSIKNMDQVFEVCFSRSPYSMKNVAAYWQLKQIISENSYDIIHCNTPMGGILTRLAARKLRKHGVKVIYTAHGFHFFKGAPLLNWLLYYTAERWMARYTDVLITINKEDYARAKNFKAGKVEYIPGVGIDIDKINQVTVDREQKRKELGVPPEAVVLLSIGELIRRKNQEVLLRAFATVDRKDIHLVICGCGVLEGFLKELSAELHIEDRVHFLGFRSDVIEICKISDIFVFPSLHEGLPVALMEAMACGLPVVCSRIRGNVDLIEDGVGGYLYPTSDVNSLVGALGVLLEDSTLRNQMGAQNLEAVKSFSLINILDQMSDIYRDMET